MQRLGQHFLKNPAAIQKIIAALDVCAGDTIIEIGAGHGELTSELRQATRDKRQGTRIIAIEKDKNLIPVLQKKFSGEKNIEIVEGDILKIFPEPVSSLNPQTADFKLVGNIPYYLTGFLLRMISELEPKPSRCIFTIQKEVAERIVAAPPRMNKLAASVQFWAKPRVIALVPKENFLPAPRVDSAIIRLDLRFKNRDPRNVEKYYRAVNILFKQPRKTILNNIAEANPSDSKENVIKKLKKTGVNPNDRPQNLSVENILELSGFLLAE